MKKLHIPEPFVFIYFIKKEGTVTMDKKYKIIRYYEKENPSQVIRRGLTLEEAQAWCKNKETSSSTCTTAGGLKRTKKFGAWFDGYASE